MRALKCRQLVELVTDYLEYALDADVRTETEEHLAGCADCLRYLGQMQTVIRILGELGGGGSPNPAAPNRTTSPW